MEVITSRQNPLFQRVRKLNASNTFRRQEGLFVCEGPKMWGEAQKWDVDVQLVIKSPKKFFPAPPACRVVETPYDVLASLSDTRTPQEPLFLCPLPDTALPEVLPPGRYLVLDGVQDPGNLGTIWRTADAFGAAGLLLTGACGDPFSPKTVRASMGACFRLSVWRGEGEAVRDLLKKSRIPLYAAALGEDAADVRAADLARAAVVIGSEGRGVSPGMLARAEGTLKIPMAERCESLNAAVAAAVVLWEGRRGEK